PCAPLTQVWCNGGSLYPVTITATTVTGILGGPASLCAGGATLTLSDATAGGTWTSATPAVASVVSGPGVVTRGGGGTSGPAVITYATSCGSTTTTITVNPVPAAITGTATLC